MFFSLPDVFIVGKRIIMEQKKQPFIYFIAQLLHLFAELKTKNSLKITKEGTFLLALEDSLHV